MNKMKELYKENMIYIIFSYLITFFLICSYIFGCLDGFNTFGRLLLVLFISLFLTPFTSFLVIKLANFEVRIKYYSKKEIRIVSLFNKRIFYLISIFLLQLPVFLAFYPGFCYYDINTQVEQYQIPYFVLNHPLLHTLFIGFFQGLFRNVNTGYCFATLIQMILVDGAMAYSLHYIYQKKHCKKLSIFGILFYGLFPINSLLSISTTKDILFAAFTLIYFIDLIRMEDLDFNWIWIIRFILNTVLMLLLRNNAIYAFIPSTVLLLFIINKKKHEYIKRYLILFTIVLVSFVCINKGLTKTLHAVPGSIKETMSIPSQQLARIYLNTEDKYVKEKIQTYISEPEKYCYYLSDAIKEQLPFDTLDSSCKHFLLDTAIFDLKYPVICFDAAFYNVQGYWDLFHSPYQTEHFFLASGDYRGGATLDSKITALSNLYIDLFNCSKRFQGTPLSVFLGCALYIWIFLFFFIRSVKRKNRQYYCSCLFPFFYLLTLLLGPGAIIRYGYIFILITPFVLSSFILDSSSSS